MPICSFEGCTKIVSRQYCDEHQGHRPTKKDTGSKQDFRKFYGSTRWKRLRKHHREQNPLCAVCLKAGFLTPMKVVDHIVPIQQGGDPMAVDGLQSLCQLCHNQKISADRGEGGR